MEQHLEGKNSHIVIPMETFNRDGVEELIDHSIKENDNLKKKKTTELVHGRSLRHNEKTKVHK